MVIELEKKELACPICGKKRQDPIPNETERGVDVTGAYSGPFWFCSWSHLYVWVLKWCIDSLEQRR